MNPNKQLFYDHPAVREEGYVRSEGDDGRIIWIPPPPPIPIKKEKEKGPVTLNVSGTPIQVKYETLLLLGLNDDDFFIERDILHFREVLYWLQTKNVKTVSKEAFLEAYYWNEYTMMSDLIRRRCDLRYLNLQGMDLSLVNFTGADLSHVLVDKNTKLPQKRMRYVKFDEVDLSGLSFVAFDFRGADFSKAIITGCDFTDALFDDKTKFRGDGDLTGTKFVRCDLRSWGGVSVNSSSILTNADFSFSKLPRGLNIGFTVPLRVSGVSFHGVEGLVLIDHQRATIFENCDISFYGKSLHIGRMGHDNSESFALNHIKLEGKTVMRNAKWNLNINWDLRSCDMKGALLMLSGGTHQQTKLPLDLMGCYFDINNGFSLPGTGYILEKCVFEGSCLNEILRCSDRFAGSVFENVTGNGTWVPDGRKRDFRNCVFKRLGCYTQIKDVFVNADLSGASFKEATNMFHVTYKKNWTNVDITEVDFSNCLLEGEDFSKSRGVPKSFEKGNLKNVVFNSETGKNKTKSLKGCNFMGVDLREVKMINCDLTGCDFTGCNLKDCDFSYSVLKNVKAMDRTEAMKVAKLSAVNFECCICFCEDGDIVKLAPCNHSECCITCVLKLMSEKGMENQCPICRGEVTGWNKL
jgi:uncharacterized protein YjbI with pentapeptide repeats